MKYSITILFLAICSFAHAQTTVLTADPSLPIPKLSFDEKGDLKLTASATSSPGDFDFLVGKWKMHNRRLNKRLEDCKDWTEFDSYDENWKMLSGTADADIYSTLRCQARRVNVSKDSRCGSLIRRPSCGACIGLPATPASWIHLW
jgi:hypothetical protein